MRGGVVVTDREFDFAVLGATGTTGRLVIDRLDRLVRQRPVRWAAAGRDRGRVEDAIAALHSATPPAAITADLSDRRSLEALAARTRVVFNLAGPYTRTAEAVVAACIGAGASYVDLSGEIPLISEVTDRYDAAARAAGVQVVQTAGWESFPPDLVTLVACSRALAGEPRGSWTVDGPGAGEGISRVDVSARIVKSPPGLKALRQAVSSGTVESLAVQLLDDAAAARIGDPAAFLAAGDDAETVRRASPFRLRPYARRGRVVAAAFPIAVLNAPVVHRTAQLLATEAGRTSRPARFRDGIDVGPARGLTALGSLSAGALLGGVQRGYTWLARAPRPVRRATAAVLRWIARRLPSDFPDPGLDGWSWQVRADAVSSTGSHGTATLHGRGHLGYGASATFVVALGLRMLGETGGRRTGCVTPALVLGIDGVDDVFGGDLRLSV